jgi:hypothetical protein
MVKRVGSSALWFLSVGWGFNLFATFAGVPELPGLIVAGAVAVFVGIDPMGLFWPPLDRPTLPRVATQASATGGVRGEI